MPLSDTSPAAKKVQMEIFASMSGEQRILWALEASELTREFAKSKIRSDHPDWSEAQISREVLRLQFLPGELPAGLQ
jgi:hypothetical protein